MISLELFQLGEIIHGSEKERRVINLLRNRFGGNLLPVKTKEWIIKNFEFYVNGKPAKASLLPYTFGYVKGIVGREISYFEMPPHPFMVKELYESAVKKGFKGVIFYDNGKQRRITVGRNIPAVFTEIPLNVGDEIEIVADSYLVDVESYNLEVEMLPGDEYIIIGAHVDHWLTGYHDNLFSIEIIDNLKPNLRNHGLKYVFFSSEEGPRCCTGSSQYKKNKVFLMISLDALFPDKVVFSATPDLYQFAKFFNIKRIEMPTPFSDHFTFVQEGYPAMVLYNDDLIPWYHSNKDLPIQKDMEYLNDIVSGLNKMLEEVDKLSREELDNTFFNYAKSQGYHINKREGSIVPYRLSSIFRQLL